MFSLFTTINRNTDAPEMPSIASLMATKGVQSTPDTAVEVPNIIIEKKEEPQTATAPAPVEPTNAKPNAEQGKPESPTQGAEPKATPAQTEPPPKVPTLQEVLKSQQPDTILKELGFDDKAVKLLNTVKENKQMLAFFDHWATNGNTTEFLREANTDYSKMPAEEVLRQQLRLEYPEATEKQLNALFKAEVLNAYKLDPDMHTAEEIEESRDLMTARADKFRKTLIERQQNFLLPKPPEPKATEPNDGQQQAIQALEAYKSEINSNPTFKNIVANKVIQIGEGDEAFNFPIPEPKEVFDLLTDGEKLGKVFQAEDGSRDISKEILTTIFASDPKNFIKELGKHFLALGGKKAIDPLENAKPPESGTPAMSEAAPKTAAEAMAKQGVVRQ